MGKDRNKFIKLFFRQFAGIQPKGMLAGLGRHFDSSRNCLPVFRYVFLHFVKNDHRRFFIVQLHFSGQKHDFICRDNAFNLHILFQSVQSYESETRLEILLVGKNGQEKFGVAVQTFLTCYEYGLEPPSLPAPEQAAAKDSLFKKAAKFWVERGTFDELMAARGYFYGLYTVSS